MANGETAVQVGVYRHGENLFLAWKEEFIWIDAIAERASDKGDPVKHSRKFIPVPDQDLM
jgi:hypothetical protein